MYCNQPMTFENITESLRSLLTHCTLTETAATERLSRTATYTAAERIRWSLDRQVTAAIAREYTDALLDDHAAIAQDAATLPDFDADAATVGVAIKWAHYLHRTIDEGVNGRADLSDQLLQSARLEYVRRLVEWLGIANRHSGLSNEDWHAVFAARAAAELARKSKLARAELVKLAGVYLVRVFDGHGAAVHELGLISRRKPDAMAEAQEYLTAREWDVPLTDRPTR